MTDVGEKLFCIVTAHNSLGSGVAHSNVVGPVAENWTPADLPGLLAWYDATVGVLDAVAGAPCDDSDPVVQWSDQSGHGWYLGYAAGTNPIYDTTGLNGLPTVVLSNSDMRMVGAPITTVTNSLSVFVVAQMLTDTPSDGLLVLYHGNGTEWYDALSCAFFYRDLTTNTAKGYRAGIKSGSAISLATSYRLGSIYDGANHTFYVNNVASSTVASSGAFGSLGQIRVGRIGQSWSGPVSEIIATSTALSPAERARLEAYLVAKWGF